MAQKKSFIDEINPAMSFISKQETREEKTEPKPGRPPKHQKINPQYIEMYVEKKDRRLQLVMKQSLYKKVKAQAKQEKQSINNYIHIVLENALKEKE